MDGFKKKRLTFTGAGQIDFETATEQVSLALISGGPVAYSLTGKTISSVTDDETNQLDDVVDCVTWDCTTKSITLYSSVESTIQILVK